MIDDIINDSKSRMAKSIEALKSELAKIRTGRAHPSLLEHVTVSYYGQPVPLSQVASVSVLDARTLSVSPWEKPLIPDIEKAIMSADLGLNPVTSGDLIRVPLPALTEDSRRGMVKLVKGEAENARVAIRNIRRDANNKMKDLLKAKDITEDDQRRSEDAVQKLTDKQIAEVETLLAVKEKDLMEV